MLWCKLAGECISLEQFVACKASLIPTIARFMTDRDAQVSKAAIATISHLQIKTNLNFAKVASEEDKAISQVYLRSLASSVSMAAQNLPHSAANLLLSLKLALECYKAEENRDHLDVHLGSHILELVESELIFSRVPGVPELAEQISAQIMGQDASF